MSHPSNASSAIAPEFLESLIARAQAAGASDIHLQITGDGADIAFRLDGLLAPAMQLDRDLAERLFGRIKFLARLKTYQDALPQDGRIEKAEVKASHDIRVATYPTVTGEKIVLRLFTTEAGRNLRELQLADDVLSELDGFLRQSSGMLLLTGPAGSGKTSTIYGCLRELSNAGGRHIITIEDPVEQIIPGIMQTEINEARGLTFATAARHLLRQDPQVLVIGEIRDDETANLAVRAALTGHLVISTLHAGSCKGVVERMFVMCSDHYAVVSSLHLVVNQRLIRRLCPECHGTGCANCLQSGYRGRLPVAEWIRFNDEVRTHVRVKGVEGLRPARPLEESARQLCSRSLTNAAECTRLFGLQAEKAR